MLRKRLSRSALAQFLAQHPPTIVAMEACSGAHHWGRVCQNFGHEVRLVPAQYARIYVKTHKNDRADAEAIVEAASRPSMCFAPVKSEEQQAVQAIHRVRARLKRDRTAVGNEIRGLMAEFGIVFPRALAELRRGMDRILAVGESDELPTVVLTLLGELREDIAYPDGRIKVVDGRIRSLNRQSEACRRLMTIPGVGALNASAFVAAIGNGAQFRRGRDLAAWLGLVPRQHSSGDRERLLGISKHGNSYLRGILIHGARACVSAVVKRRTPPRTRFEQWILDLIGRKHINTVVVPVANKLARYVWAVLRFETDFFSPPARQG